MLEGSTVALAALTTVERTLMEIRMIAMSDAGDAENQRAEMVAEAGHWFDRPERRLGGREWIACADFTVADILLATLLREIRKTDPIDPYPRLKPVMRGPRRARPGSASQPPRKSG